MRRPVLLLFLAACATPRTDHDADQGEFVLSAYGGAAQTFDSDIEVNGTTLPGVSWDDESFKDPYVDLLTD